MHHIHAVFVTFTPCSSYSRHVRHVHIVCVTFTSCASRSHRVRHVYVVCVTFTSCASCVAFTERASRVVSVSETLRQLRPVHLFTLGASSIAVRSKRQHRCVWSTHACTDCNATHREGIQCESGPPHVTLTRHFACLGARTFHECATQLEPGHKELRPKNFTANFLFYSQPLRLQNELTTSFSVSVSGRFLAHVCLPDSSSI